MYSRSESTITFTQDTTPVLSESSIREDPLTVVRRERDVPLCSRKPSIKSARSNATTLSDILPESLKKNHPVLDPKKERELLERVAKGDLEARETLAKHNVGLVISIAKKYPDNGTPFEDLFMEGFSGLLKGIDKYDISHPKAPKLSTYATFWIRKGIIEAIETHSRLIQMPRGITQLYRRIKKTECELYTSTGVIPSPKEIAEKLDIPETSVGEILNSEYNSRTFSLNTPVSEQDDSDTIRDLIPGRVDVENEVLGKVFTEGLFLIIYQSDLTDRERGVFMELSGCLSGEIPSDRFLGRELNLTVEEIREAYNSAINKLSKSQPLRQALFGT